MFLRFGDSIPVDVPGLWEVGSPPGGPVTVAAPAELAGLAPGWLSEPAPNEAILGVTIPGGFTPPLRELTKETSLGFECLAFGVIVLGFVFDPWQAWTLIHMLELNEDGTFRFRTYLLLVARQNGKTTLMQALTLWALFTCRARLVVGTAQDLDVARESWDSCRVRIEEDPTLSTRAPRGFIKTGNGKEEIKLKIKRKGKWIYPRYKIKATNADAGRGIPGVGLLLLDELRTHKDHQAYAALSNTTMAVPNALMVGMSNAGTDESIVLNELFELAQSGEDPTLGYAYYGAPTDDLDDQHGWAHANPSLGYGRLTLRALQSARNKARKSLKAQAVFLVENMCRWVEAMDYALDPVAWRGSASKASLEEYRTARWYGAVDVSLDGDHVSLIICTPTEDGPVRVWVAKTWEGVQEARAELPAVLKALKLRKLGWCPSGPAAELGAVIRGCARKPGSLRGMELVEYQGVKLSEATMGLAAAVKARQVWHQDEGVLNAQVAGCSKLWQGDRYVFTRRGSGHADAVYALAIGVHVTMTAVPPRKPWSVHGQGQPEAVQAEDLPVPG